MPNTDQIEYWNGEAGATWVTQAEALDSLLREVGDAVIAHSKLKVGDSVLDIGCGSGALTLAAQARVGNTGQATGLDISKPLIQNAERRAGERKSRALFRQADASTWRADEPVDAIVSRFGVMFFDDPTAAFANILQSIKPGGVLTFACWRSPKENDMGGGLMKAVSHLFTPPEVKPDPTAPGPFAFADQTYVSTFLDKAGWRDVNFTPWDGRLPLTGNNAQEVAGFLARMGPIGRVMREQNVAVESVIDALIPFLETRKQNEAFALNGAVWIVTARRAA